MIASSSLFKFSSNSSQSKGQRMITGFHGTGVDIVGGVVPPPQPPPPPMTITITIHPCD